MALCLITVSPAFAQSDDWDPTNATPAPSELSAENLPNLGGTPSEDTGSDKPVGDSDSGSSSSSSKKSESLMKVSWKELKEYQGQVGEKNWKALFKSFARSWGSKEDDQWAAEHRNRYDMTLFGKKYENVAGHETKVSVISTCIHPCDRVVWYYGRGLLPLHCSGKMGAWEVRVWDC